MTIFFPVVRSATWSARPVPLQIVGHPSGFAAAERPLLRFDVSRTLASTCTGISIERRFLLGADTAGLGETSGQLAAFIACVAADLRLNTDLPDGTTLWATGSLDDRTFGLRQDYATTEQALAENLLKIHAFRHDLRARFLVMPGCLARHLFDTRVEVVAVRKLKNRNLLDGTSAKTILLVGENDLLALTEALFDLELTRRVPVQPKEVRAVARDLSTGHGELTGSGASTDYEPVEARNLLDELQRYSERYGARWASRIMWPLCGSWADVLIEELVSADGSTHATVLLALLRDVRQPAFAQHDKVHYRAERAAAWVPRLIDRLLATSPTANAVLMLLFLVSPLELSAELIHSLVNLIFLNVASISETQDALSLLVRCRLVEEHVVYLPTRFCYLSGRGFSEVRLRRRALRAAWSARALPNVEDVVVASCFLLLNSSPADLNVEADDMLAFVSDLSGVLPVECRALGDELVAMGVRWASLGGSYEEIAPYIHQVAKPSFAGRSDLRRSMVEFSRGLLNGGHWAAAGEVLWTAVQCGDVRESDLRGVLALAARTTSESIRFYKALGIPVEFEDSLGERH